MLELGVPPLTAPAVGSVWAKAGDARERPATTATAMDMLVIIVLVDIVILSKMFW
jgi:hypothetical protein